MGTAFPDNLPSIDSLKSGLDALERVLLELEKSNSKGRLDTRTARELALTGARVAMAISNELVMLGSSKRGSTSHNH